MMNPFKMPVALAVLMVPVLAQAATPLAGTLSASLAIKGKPAAYRAQAEQVLQQLVADGLPVSQALAVVEASAANRFSATDLGQVAEQTGKTVAAARAAGGDTVGTTKAVADQSVKLITHYHSAAAVTQILGAEQTALARHVPVSKVLQITDVVLASRVTEGTAVQQILAYKGNTVRVALPQEIQSLQTGAAAMANSRALSSISSMMPGAPGPVRATMSGAGGMTAGGGMGTR